MGQLMDAPCIASSRVTLEIFAVLVFKFFYIYQTVKGQGHRK